ncbi:hypothetical protein L6452_20948 [Arctium lappa]|uniref:Uncharacterized protein n=1 Tax=Arctium lappa TaxID=4217 RepID=A0ACB9BE34_ARCLA|nr:hypothetical protein L6452_20948 [Arctium lappa]
MSLSGRRRRSTTMYVLLLILFSVLQIWVFSSDCCRVRAIRTTLSSSSKQDSDEIKRSELYSKYFNGRYPKVINTATVSKGKGFQENKRKIPSCPDALHN